MRTRVPMRKELVNQLMRSNGNRKNRRSGRAFALSGNVKFPPLAIREVSFTLFAHLCSSGSAYRFDWQRSCAPTHPTCGSPSCRFSARAEPLHSFRIIRAPSEHCQGRARDDSRGEFGERQILRQTFVKSRSFYWGLRSVGNDAGNNFFLPACVAPRTGRHFV